MNKKILILGGLGFIGTNLIEELINHGNYKIIIFEAENVDIKNPELLKQIEIYYGDFHNKEDYEKIFKENTIDIVFHLINTTNPSSSNEDMIFDIKSNLINTINLLNVMLNYKCKNLIYFSSGGTIYGDSKRKNKRKESDPKEPICSYGIVKLAVEKYLYLYNKLYDLNYLILRISNPYGEYHNYKQQGLINVILRRVLNGEPVEVWGDGTVVRDYIYVKDLVKIIVDLLEEKIQNEIINVGSGKGYSINSIIEVIKKEIGYFQIRYQKSRRVDIPHLVLNVDKLNNLINIKLTSIEEGINRTVKWLKAL